uniref:Uncharacterized protein n=1 Tax=Anguilla anguilla TaxID=7936 RepID=A0A0E9V3J2_ANGAN
MVLTSPLLVSGLCWCNPLRSQELSTVYG